MVICKKKKKKTNEVSGTYFIKTFLFFNGVRTFS